MLKLEPRPQPRSSGATARRCWRWSSPCSSAWPCSRAGQGPGARPAGVFLGAHQDAVCPGRTDGQGHAAAGDRAGAGGVLSLQCLEHRRRGAVRDRRDCRAAAWRCWPTRTTGAGSCWPSCWPGWLGGMAWAGITALLRDRFNASEILVSLMLVYVADMVLSYLVYGPWKDPAATTFRRPRPSRR
jgi:hypothetical protein